jgi:hypothetical protein
LQGIQASEIFSKIVAAQMEDDGEEDE